MRRWSDGPAITGQDSAVEALHLYNVTAADVGTWHITLTAPAGLASELVRATAFWQGAVRALITASPPNAKPGQQIKVTLDVLGPNGPDHQPGDALQPARGRDRHRRWAGRDRSPVPVTRGQRLTRRRLGGLVYRRRDQSTTLTFNGTAAGYGLYATQVPATVGVGAQTQGLTATPEFTGGNSVQAGGTHRRAGRAHQPDRVSPAGQAEARGQRRDRDAQQPERSGRRCRPAARPPFRSPSPSPRTRRPVPPSLEVTAVDAANGQVLQRRDQQNFTITKPPGFLAKYLVGLLAIIIVVILVDPGRGCGGAR